MSEFKSQLSECILILRHPDDILFHINRDGEVLCDLEGYTILPNEEYKKLQSEIGTRNI